MVCSEVRCLEPLLQRKAQNPFCPPTRKGEATCCWVHLPDDYTEGPSHSPESPFGNQRVLRGVQQCLLLSKVFDRLNRFLL